MGLVKTENQQDDPQREDGQSNDIVHDATSLHPGTPITGVFPQNQPINAGIGGPTFAGISVNHAAADESGTSRAVQLSGRVQP